MNDWYKTEELLPPCDDIYEVMDYICNKPQLAYYNGLGFLVMHGEYFNANVWRFYKHNHHKKYGKQK